MSKEQFNEMLLRDQDLRILASHFPITRDYLVVLFSSFPDSGGIADTIWKK